jgi:glycosyltransferase involved in cell wall biosynthesis
MALLSLLFTGVFSQLAFFSNLEDLKMVSEGPSPEISVVVPCFREEESLPVLAERLLMVFTEAKVSSFEIIFVNDGSPDETWRVIKELVKTSTHFVGVNLSRNFGHQAALEAGLSIAKGDAVISMDADLQHPPELIPEMVDAWRAGAMVVQAQRAATEDASAFKAASSKFFYGLFRKLTGMEIISGAADFRLLDKKVVKLILGMPEREKFFRGLVTWVGFKQKIIPYVADRRQFGKSSYTLRRMIRFAKVGLLSNTVRPLNWIILLGIGTVLLGSVSFIGMLFTKVFVSWDFFSGSALLATLVVSSNGMLLIAMGIMSLYLAAIANQTQGRPSFVISDITGLSKSK